MNGPSFERAAAALRRYARERETLARNRQLASWSSNYHDDYQRSLRATGAAERAAKAELQAYIGAAEVQLGNRELTPAEADAWVEFWVEQGQKREALVGATQKSAARIAA